MRTRSCRSRMRATQCPPVLVVAYVLVLSVVTAGAAEPRFTEVAGVRELSGRLIVRPLQPPAEATGQARSMVDGAAPDVARARLTPHVLKHAAAVDEYVVAVPSGMRDAEFAAALLETGDYEYVEPDWLLYPVATEPNDPRLSEQWHHARIESYQAWDYLTGAGVTVAIVDTGCDADHPDLQGLYVPGYYTVYPDQLEETYAGELTDDNVGHGTHVAGCAAAHGDNGIGVAGVGWNFDIMPIKVTNTNGALLSDLTGGARWAVDHGAKVINVSFEGVGASAIRSAGAYIKANGGLLLWAAGNANSDLGDWDHSEYVVVGATSTSDAKASFSNYGRPIDVVAPGTSILSTINNGDYGLAGGTSMASPITAGVVAMIWSANTEFTPDQVQGILYASVDDIGPAGEDDTFGHGRVNLKNAVIVALDFETEINIAVDSWPNSGAFINVIPADMHGDTYGWTWFTREYVYDTSVSFSALATHEGSPFVWWEVDGVAQARDQQQVYVIAQEHTSLRAMFAATVDVHSIPPGAYINLAPADLDAQGAAFTPFTRLYAQPNVVFYAPDTHDGEDFFEWRVADEPQLSGTTLYADLPGPCVVEAIFGESYDLSVSSEPASGVAITATADRRGAGVGTTPFDRLYATSTSVTLTAPLLTVIGESAYRFDRWTTGGIEQPAGQLETTVLMDEPVAAAAGYRLVGDLDCDGSVNNGDIDAFVMVLHDPPTYRATYPECDEMLADINGDGWANNGDIDAFVEIILR